MDQVGRSDGSGRGKFPDTGRSSNDPTSAPTESGPQLWTGTKTPQMKEILYIQAGTLPNFVGAHFWNTQESYFQYGNDADEPEINHDVSFREGLSPKVRSTSSCSSKNLTVAVL
jgi:hypothetical protein